MNRALQYTATYLDTNLGTYSYVFRPSSRGRRPLGNLVPHGIPNPGINQRPLLLLLLISHRALVLCADRSGVLDIKLAHGPIHEPLPGSILGRRVPDVVDQTHAPAGRGRTQVPHANRAVARLGDEAHGGESEPRARRHGVDEAPQARGRRARRSRQVDVYVRHKGRRGVCHEEDGDDAAQGDLNCVSVGVGSAGSSRLTFCRVPWPLVGLDVARHDEAGEEGPDEEARQFEHGQERGSSCAGVVYDEALGDFCAC